MKIRYIKDYLKGHTNNSMNSDWTEIKAIDYQGNNIALGKTVTASSTPSWGTLDRVTDGVIEGDVSVGIASNEKQWVQVDLGEVYSIDYLHIWHYYVSSRRFNDTKVEVSEDGVTWTVIFDSAIEGTYDETSEGRKFTLPYSVDLDELSMSASLNQINSKVSNIKDEISTIKNVLKTNLATKGVETSDNDKISNLINKVKNIELGRKWNSGSAVSASSTKTFNFLNSGSKSLYYITINNLNFSPKIIIAYGNQSGSYPRPICTTFISDAGGVFGGVFNYSGSETSKFVDFAVRIDSQVVNGNTITIPVYDEAGLSFSWIAIE